MFEPNQRICTRSVLISQAFVQVEVAGVVWSMIKAALFCLLCVLIVVFGAGVLWCAFAAIFRIGDGDEDV